MKFDFHLTMFWWWCRGLPLWLHEIPGIVYRSDNEPFKVMTFNFPNSIQVLDFQQELVSKQF